MWAFQVTTTVVVPTVVVIFFDVVISHCLCDSSSRNSRSCSIFWSLTSHFLFTRRPHRGSESSSFFYRDRPVLLRNTVYVFQCETRYYNVPHQEVNLHLRHQRIKPLKTQRFSGPRYKANVRYIYMLHVDKSIWFFFSQVFVWKCTSTDRLRVTVELCVNRPFKRHSQNRQNVVNRAKLRVDTFGRQNTLYSFSDLISVCLPPQSPYGGVPWVKKNCEIWSGLHKENQPLVRRWDCYGVHTTYE